MHTLYIVLIAIGGLAVGFVLAWQIARARIVRLETELEHEVRSTGEKLQIINEAKENLSEKFKALSSDVLRDNSRTFLDQARKTLESISELADKDLEGRQKAVEHLVEPIKESLNRVNAEIADMEKARREAYGDLLVQVKQLSGAHETLKMETVKLVKALRSPKIGGMWGEIQLRRVVELAGMAEHYDFIEQPSVSTEEGRLVPDMMVNLPGGRQVIIDAKVSTEAYLNAVETDDEISKNNHLQVYARHVRNHVKSLGEKGYWEHLPETTEFVVMFLPGENLLSAALEQDPGLIEFGVDRRVILATPTTLISLLKAIAYGWRQESLARSAHKVSELGQILYDRLRVLARHFTGVGSGLEQATRSYNKAVGSLEMRVLSAARNLKDYGISVGDDIKEVEKIGTDVRPIQAGELADEEKVED
jgi:DNA recombination protein RmuC